MLKLANIIILALATATAAHAQAVVKQKDWTSSIHTWGPSCHAGTKGRNGQVTLAINFTPPNARWAPGRSLGVYLTGYNPRFGRNANPTLKIGKRTYRLAYNPDYYDATPINEAHEQEIIQAIRRGHKATFTANTKRGPVNDEFSLMGATAISNHAARRCQFASALHEYPSRAQPTRQTRTVATQQQPRQAQPTTIQDHDVGCVLGETAGALHSNWDAIESGDVASTVLGIFSATAAMSDCE